VDSIVENFGFREIEKIILNFQPKIVIINAATPSIENDLSTCQIVKRANHSISTAIIGIHGTALPEECLQLQNNLDFVIRGEPEFTTLELCQTVKNNGAFQSINGLSYRDGSRTVHNPDREVVADLNTLPFPAWDLINTDKYRMPFTDKKFLLAATSRGCPYQCVFCADGAYYGKKLRMRSPAKIVDEIEWVVSQFKINNFLFWSESFTINSQFAMNVAEEIINRKLNIEWVCNSRVDNVNLELLTTIKKAGCWMIGYGVESGNEMILRQIKKQISTRDIINAVGLAKKVGLEVTAHCVLGFPQDTKETILETIEFVKRLDVNYVQFYCAVPFPGSELFNEAKKNDWICSDDWRKFEQNFSVLNTPHLTAKEIMRLRNFAYRSFYLRPKTIWRIIRQIRTFPQFINLIKGTFDFLNWI
jgi:radical SAM superfamily enzyme YgiQ (UPF0313 family)